MKEVRNIPCWFLLVIVLFLSGSCERRHSEDEEQTILGDIETAEIPLDDAEGEPSLTRNFYFIIDGSGSMNGDDCGGQFASRVEGAKWAVEEFLKSIPDDANIGLYVFDYHSRREVVELEVGNRTDFLEAVRDIEAGGGTPLASSIEFGVDRLVEQFKKQLGYGDYRLIVVTDGEANKIPSAARYAMRYNIPIYTIGLCMDASHELSRFSVSYQAAGSSEELAKALAETVAESETFDPTVFEAIR